MKKEFIPYQEAFELKELGFDEPCLSYYEGESFSCHLASIKGDDYIIPAPLFQQAFRWFREKHDMGHSIDEDWDNGHLLGYEYVIYQQEGVTVSKTYHTYEEAEKECLIKLIEIVKENGK